MYKPRDKYFGPYNNGNIINRIMEASSFTPYEFMSLRYACCELIAKDIEALELECKDTIAIVNPKLRKHYKNRIKQLQKCINKLDNFYLHK